MISPELIYIVDDDRDLAASVARLLRRHDLQAEPFHDPATLLEAYPAAPAACVLTDVMMEGLDGFAFVRQLRQLDPAVSIIFMTAWPTTAHAVDSIRVHGGVDYLEKPIDEERLLASIRQGLNWARGSREFAARTAALTSREREVLALLARGYSTKAIASELNISARTVDDHRAQISTKTGANSLAKLIALSALERGR
ncbi:MAG TPA: response regulator [Sphingomicrobium sp.]|nr:response regulator [Sphingomicrobium sp.]